MQQQRGCRQPVIVAGIKGGVSLGGIAKPTWELNALAWVTGRGVAGRWRGATGGEGQQG